MTRRGFIAGLLAAAVVAGAPDLPQETLIFVDGPACPVRFP